MVVDGVGCPRFGFVVVVEFVYVGQDGLRKGGEAVHGVHEIAGEEFVEYVGLVRNHVVYESDATCLSILFDASGDGAEAGGYKRHPIGKDDEVGFAFADFSTCLYPVEGVAAVHTSGDLQAFWSWIIGELGLPWKKEFGVLKCKCDHFDSVSLGEKLGPKSFIESGKSASVGVCGTNNDDIHNELQKYKI